MIQPNSSGLTRGPRYRWCAFDAADRERQEVDAKEVKVKQLNGAIQQYLLGTHNQPDKLWVILAQENGTFEPCVYLLQDGYLVKKGWKIDINDEDHNTISIDQINPEQIVDVIYTTEETPDISTWEAKVWIEVLMRHARYGNISALTRAANECLSDGIKERISREFTLDLEWLMETCILSESKKQQNALRKEWEIIWKAWEPFLVSEVIPNGARLRISSYQWTLLHIAALLDSERHPLATRFLLNTDIGDVCDIEARTSNGQTPLFFALQFDCSLATVGALLGARASVTTKDTRGYTPLHKAVQNGNSANVNLLLEISQSFFVKNNGTIDDVRGEQRYDAPSPMHLAVESSETSATHIMRLLLISRAFVDEKNDMGETPLHLATKLENEACVRVLLEWGASVDERNADGETALDMALALENDLIICLLRK